MTDSRLAQIEYEESSDAAAQAARLTELRNKSAEGDVNLPRASAVMKAAFSKVYDVLQARSETRGRGINGKYLNWLRSLPTDVAATLSIRTCMQLCMAQGSGAYVHIQELTTTLGRMFELEVRIREAEKVNPEYMRRIAEQLKDRGTVNVGHITRLYNVAIERVMKEHREESLTSTERLHIGKFGVDACLEAGIIQINRGRAKGGTAVNFELNPEIMEYLTGYGHEDVRNVISRAETIMMYPPDEWTNLNDGGYLTVRRKAQAPLLQLDNVRRSLRARIANALTAEKAPLLFEAINYLQSIPYTIHEPTRDAITRLWQSGGGALGVPRLNPPQRPVMPLGETWIKEGASEEELAIFKRWKRQVVDWHEEFKRWRGKALEIGGFLKASKKSGQPLWFPMYLDKRARGYYRGVPNPQGSDLAKAVTFNHDKHPLTAEGVFWLKVSIANHRGYDTERMVDRARWTEQNWPAIENALDEPENFPEVWGKDAPWCMFAAAYELREAYRSGNPNTYRTGIIIHQDATCSGLQHFSALLRDPVGARYVNLDDPMKSGPKQDIYTRVGAMALSAMQPDLTGDDLERGAMAKWWSGVGIPRKLAKKPVMTYVYGATLGGTADFVESTMESEIFPELSINWEDELKSSEYSMYAGRKLFEGVANTVPAAEAGMQWLRQLASKYPSGKPMVWTSPIGMQVIHDYQDYDTKEVQLKSCGMHVTLLREWNDNTRPHAMRNAIAPNFIHSLDASHMFFTALKMKAQGLNMVGIHDSFGTHPAHVNKMRDCIREAFVEMYTQHNPMAQLLWDIDVVAEPPMRGTFDLRNVLDSEFFFS
jgi:DNA-directed RNA polymerase